MVSVNLSTSSLVILLVFLDNGMSCFNKDIRECYCESDYKFMKESGRKVACSNKETTDYLELFIKNKLPKDVISIYLSSNRIPHISSRLFTASAAASWKHIIELSLGENEISYVGPDTFQHFENLKSLNLSYNRIGRLNKEMFRGLNNLSRLLLNYNTFPVISGDAFNYLPSIKKLQLNSDYLICNCLMKDFITWYRKRRAGGLKLYGMCKLPLSKQDTALRKLKPNALVCDKPSVLPSFEIEPSQTQVVFKGDDLLLFCEGTDLSSSKVSWSLNGDTVNSTTNVYNETTVLFHNKTTIASSVQLQVSPSCSGTWSCSIRSNFSYDMREVQIVVLSKETTYCSKELVENEYGLFKWPETVSGANVSLGCHVTSSRNGLSDAANRSCLPNGLWSPGNYSQCQYVDQGARMLRNALEQNFTATSASDICQETSSHLSAVKIKEAIGIELLAKLMQKCSKHLRTDAKRILSTEVQFASQAMTLPSDVLITSQVSAHVCHVINDVIVTSASELLTTNVSFFSVNSLNIGINGYIIHDDVTAIHCNVSINDAESELRCSTKEVGKSEESMQPSLSLPVSALDELKSDKIIIAVYRNGSLFQSPHSHTMSWKDYEAMKVHIPPRNASAISTIQHQYLTSKSKHTSASDRSLEYHVIVSSVYSIRSDNKLQVNLSTPITLLFHTRERALLSKRRHYIASWNGVTWVRGNPPCVFVPSTIEQQKSNITIVQCNALATIAVMKELHDNDDGRVGHAASPTLHVIVYVGSFILCASLFLVVFTYIAFSNLLISRDAKHMVLNICIHLLLAVLAFVVGIMRVNHQILCYSSGVCIHYSSLSVLLWIVLSARNVSKEMLVSQQPPPSDPKPQKPILRFYLLGCGVPVIVCGITAAAKIQNYNGDENNYCWLSWESSLYAFYAPAALIAIGCLLVLLRILATLNCNQNEMNSHRNNHDNSTIGEETPLRCHNPSFNGNAVASPSMLPAHKEIENEQSFRVRTRGLGLTLFFFIGTWVFAALSVASLLTQMKRQYSEDFQESDFDFVDDSDEESSSTAAINIVFSCAYFVFALATGLFVIVQHVTSRRDVTDRWKYVCKCRGKALTSEGMTRRSGKIVRGNNRKVKENKSDHTASVTEEGMTLETTLPATCGEETSLTNQPSLIEASESRLSSPAKSSSFIVNSLHRDVVSYTRKSSLINDECVHDHTNSSYMQIPGSSNVLAHSPHKTAAYSKQHYPHTGARHYYKHHEKKAMKVNNLNYHESSLTEHSFDDSHMRMHVVPVSMQRNQPKVDNSVLYKRYQRIKKNLEAKRSRDRKLTVLREYAQDPLTSNDEGKDGESCRRTNERMPLLSPGFEANIDDDNTKDDIAINEYKKAELLEKLNIHNSEVPKYRTLLISSPNRKKHDVMVTSQRKESVNVMTNYNRLKCADEGLLDPHKPKLQKENSTPLKTIHNSSCVVSCNSDNINLHGDEYHKPTEASPCNKPHNYLTISDVSALPFPLPHSKTSKSCGSGEEKTKSCGSGEEKTKSCGSGEEKLLLIDPQYLFRPISDASHQSSMVEVQEEIAKCDEDARCEGGESPPRDDTTV